MYKKNGYYYILMPSGGVEDGWQSCLRSRSVYGPYEYKIVMHQGNSAVNGPHQGGWVTSSDGRDWFIHFQDVIELGRIVHLQPMCFADGWPFIGQGSKWGWNNSTDCQWLQKDSFMKVGENYSADLKVKFSGITPDTLMDVEFVLVGTGFKGTVTFSNVVLTNLSSDKQELTKQEPTVLSDLNDESR